MNFLKDKRLSVLSYLFFVCLEEGGGNQKKKYICAYPEKGPHDFHYLLPTRCYSFGACMARGEWRKTRAFEGKNKSSMIESFFRFTDNRNKSLTDQTVF